MSTVVSPPVEQRVVLNASWEIYERLLAEYPDVAGPRFTYDDGAGAVRGRRRCEKMPISRQDAKYAKKNFFLFFAFFASLREMLWSV